MRINILYLADPGSIHDVKWISFFLNREDTEVFLISRRHHGSHRFPLPGVNRIGSIGDFSIFRFFTTIKTALLLKKVIKASNISIVHILYAEPNALWCVFRKFLGIPMIITCRGSDVLRTIPQFFESKSFLHLLVRKLYKMAFTEADWVTATSQSQLQAILKFSTRKQAISLIRTGIDIDVIRKDTRAFFPLRSDAQEFVLFPRLIKPVYNHQFALSAIKLLPLDIKSRFRMVFVGRDGGDQKYQKYLETLIAEIHDAKVIFLSKQPQEALFELYKRASLVIMTPLWDGTSVSATEALACGSPVILGPISYDSEIAEKAYILRSWDCSELAEAIKQSLNRPKKEDVLDSLPRSLDREHNMTEMNKIYRQLCQG